MNLEHCKWITDAGHAWLRIPVELLNGFKPSKFSYMGTKKRGEPQFVYLEEDCDVDGWIRHAKVPSAEITSLPTERHNDYCYVRNFRSCKG